MLWLTLGLFVLTLLNWDPDKLRLNKAEIKHLKTVSTIKNYLVKVIFQVFLSTLGECYGCWITPWTVTLINVGCSYYEKTQFRDLALLCKLCSIL